MRKRLKTLVCLFCMGIIFISCDKEEPQSVSNEASPLILSKLENKGFDTTTKPPIKIDEGYIVEGDIFLTHDEIMNYNTSDEFSVASKQYSTDNLVRTNGRRTIDVFISSRFDNTTSDGLDIALERYNQENLELTFNRVNSSRQADISIERLNFILDFLGVLGSAGFPTASGDPFNTISLSSRLTRLGFDRGGIATIIAHEMGHCIGFRHTDFFDRTISCGDGTPQANEGDGGVGANRIPGTPSGATVEAGSWMLACSDGGDRPFNDDDKTALDFLY